jgi:DsbC/DsbD-like thiol-disulfide interchange protein
MRAITLFCSILCALCVRHSEAAPPDHVKATFLADVKIIKPGQPFHVGLLLQIDPGWHIYWENPGESGSPTRLKITAPPGITVSPARYPIPKTFVQPGNLTGYGYEDQTMLIARVVVPQDWPKGKSIDLTADATWLNCKDVCFPGKAKLDLTIAVGDENENDNSELFERWHARLPIEGAGAIMPFSGVGPPSDLKLHWTKPVKDVEVLPVPPEGVEVLSASVDHAEKITKIKLAVRDTRKEKKPGAMIGMLVTYVEEGRQRRGARINVPLE